VGSAIALLLALAFCVYAFRRLFAGYGDRDEALQCLSAREAVFLDAAAEAMFPADGAIPLSGIDAQLPRFADRYLGCLHPRIRLQIRLLLMFFEQIPFFLPAPGRRGHRRFTRLDLEQLIAVLRAWSESSSGLRVLVFTALRAVLTMGYLGHPVALRHLRLAPLVIESPVLEPDLLYPPIGQGRGAIAYTRADLTAPSTGEPLDFTGPLHPDYREGTS
jgi:hypothetical protein